MSKQLEMNQLGVAELLGCDRNTVAALTRAGMPVARRGRGSRGHGYDLGACVRWLRAHDAAQAAKTLAAARSSSELGAARTRKTSAEARLAELRAAERGRQLVRLDEIRAGVAEIFQIVRAALLALPTGLAESVTTAARDGSPRDVERMLREAVTDALRALAATRLVGKRPPRTNETQEPRRPARRRPRSRRSPGARA